MGSPGIVKDTVLFSQSSGLPAPLPEEEIPQPVFITHPPPHPHNQYSFSALTHSRSLQF